MNPTAPVAVAVALFLAKSWPDNAHRLRPLVAVVLLVKRSAKIIQSRMPTAHPAIAAYVSTLVHFLPNARLGAALRSERSFRVPSGHV